MATIVIMAGLIFGLRQEIGDVISDLGRVNAFALLIIIPIEVLNYDAYVRLYRSFFAILKEKLNYWTTYKICLEMNFVNHILPSGGVSGISYFSLRMRTQGISTPKSTLAQMMKFLLLFVSYQPILILGLVLLAIGGHVNNLILVVTTAIITALVIGTGAAIYILESRSRINNFLLSATRVINRIIHIIRPHKKETFSLEKAKKSFDELHENYNVLKQNWRQLKKPFFFTMVANATEVAALYMVYVAFGEFVNIGAVILAYAVANFAGLISVLPAGIGIYEGLMTAVLVASGIPAAVTIPVTIMYRVVMMTIQLGPGYYFYQKALKDGIIPAQIKT